MKLFTIETSVLNEKKCSSYEKMNSFAMNSLSFKGIVYLISFETLIEYSQSI